MTREDKCTHLRQTDEQADLAARSPRLLTRRTAFALAGAAALSFLMPTTKAFAVGGGQWGAYGGAAFPGAHFGYDAAWSYSYDGCVWLSASANCTVNWLTELYVSIAVNAYVACGGIWHPTWSPDMPDTPTNAYIRDSSGVWLASAYWNIDTTYDHDWYVYMTGTNLIVDRRNYDWWAYCGADIQGLGGSAPGTHSIAEGIQSMPHHTLVNDTRWRGKIVTLRPKPAPNLFLNCSGGGVVSNTNVNFMANCDTTDQNWLVIESPYGRESLVPVHVGNPGMYLDVAEPGGDANFSNGNNVKLYPNNAAKANSVWMHHLGARYYLLVHEHNGMCLNLDGGKTTNGTNANNWDNYCRRDLPNMHFLIEEVIFRERSANSMRILGAVKTGQTVTVPNPNTACLPYNHPGTSGMYWKYTYYTGLAAGALTTVVRAASKTASYTVQKNDENTYLTCVITAFALFRNTPYAGRVQTASVLVPLPVVKVAYFVDRSSTCCYEQTVRIGSPYSIPAAATAAGTKRDCAGLSAWCIDSGYTTKYTNATVIKSPLKLYARNAVTLTYSTTTRSCINNPEHQYFLNNTCTQPATETSILPKTVKAYYGDTITFSAGPTLYFMDAGHTRIAPCNPGVYPEAAATSPLLMRAKLTRNTTVYLDWSAIPYDGIIID